MSTTSPPNTRESRVTTKESTAPVTKTPSKSSVDWLGTSLLAAKTIAAGGEMLPFPYVKGAFDIVVIMLEIVEKVKKNREDMKELCEDTVEIIKIVQGQIKVHGDTAAVKFKGLCEDLKRCLQDILNAIEPFEKEPHGFHSRFKEVVQWGRTADQIARYQKRIQTLRSNFVLTATMDINFQVHKLTTLGSNVAVPQVIQSINNCPPPSRIFHGRQIILEKMQAYFGQDLGKQNIFLLHGLGGAGKTQIALKFIQESSCFSDIFMVDASTTDTLDAAIMNIAVTKNVGDTPQDALKWLASIHHDWLLFFDNADDPNINLNSYFPQCSHGNIVITSRNPGLCVHAGLHSLVSDMEEVDAMEKPLANKEIACEIALWYLPLAIIQAGAFIAKSGALHSYLALYSQNRARLLNEKPAQSHYDYAWTVYTTWEISFKQLSRPAATLLQLCSFLHHQGISEKMFSEASTYEFTELDKPWQFITQFLGPTGVWDSFRFTEITSELRAHSLINFDINSGTFSIHPLVHSWSQSILPDQQEYHHSMIAIVGMSISTMTDNYLQLASLWLLPHIDALLQDFNYEYGSIYNFSGQYQRAADLHTDLLMRELGRFKEAGELDVSVLEKQRQLLGEDHPDTLHAMGNLACTYYALGKLKEAEELEVVVLEKRREILGGDHPDTLRSMGNLASTYHNLGKLKEAKKLHVVLKEAEELGVVVLEKQRQLLGEDHLDTLLAMGNLASTYHNQCKLKDAEELGVV
ncbi:P-loop containing nucleoside triphosphate hydrolase protein, partial [Mycena maculata]